VDEYRAEDADLHSPGIRVVGKAEKPHVTAPGERRGLLKG